MALTLPEAPPAACWLHAPTSHMPDYRSIVTLSQVLSLPFRTHRWMHKGTMV